MNDRRTNIHGLLNHGGGHRHHHGHRPDGQGGDGSGNSSARPPAAPPAPAGDAQERYVTSQGIERVRTKIDTDLKKFFSDVKGYVDDTDIPFPGWGALGTLLIGLQYSNMQNDVRAKADDGHAAADAIAKALATVRDNWRKAEDASTVVYQ